ncbi:MAG: right-handed parallel beta-helix repeat-containing protein [Saprospiraceae bacterium]|nr:right-handed parallel beta-helix repeat-containing protein [Saprospiraceae bacterium]
MKSILLFLILLGSQFYLSAQILEVGPGKTYSSIAGAAQDAQPGDSIFVYPGTYAGGIFINQLQGTATSWITIRGIGIEPITISGGTNAIQFTDPNFVVIEHFRFTQQTGNGLNIDDGGSYITPAKHVHIRNCLFEDIAATGNNDFLKLSGLDSFLIEDCTFINGAAGGSGIDMVGCHWGIIQQNQFNNLGSNSIQAKGGTRYITIRSNHFVNGGQRTLNLGGSTGAAFFRPLGANYEAADIDVYSNIIEGSWAPIAFVGSQRVKVWNNTIYQPQNWVIRILQESPDTSFYEPASYGEFINNIIVITSSVSTIVNVGPNTNPTSFTFANNLWFHQNQINWSGPTLPVPESNAIIQVDPLFENAGNFHLQPTSPAIGNGRTVSIMYQVDYESKPFLDPPSIGAFEGGKSSSISLQPFDPGVNVFPNPTQGYLHFEGPTPEKIQIIDLTGKVVLTYKGTEKVIPLNGLSPGTYYMQCVYPKGLQVAIFVLY